MVVSFRSDGVLVVQLSSHRRRVSRANAHDRDTGALAVTATHREMRRRSRRRRSLLGALEQLRLEGAIFFRSEFTEAFAFESAPLALADALAPGRRPADPVPHRRPRLVLGRGRRRRPPLGRAGRRHRAALRRPAHHRRRRRRPSACSILALLDPPPWDDDPGAPPRRRRRAAPISSAATCTPTTRCSIPRCAAFPPVFVVRLPDGPAARLGAGQHRLRARGRRAAVEREPEP